MGFDPRPIISFDASTFSRSLIRSSAALIPSVFSGFCLALARASYAATRVVGLSPSFVFSRSAVIRIGRSVVLKLLNADLSSSVASGPAAFKAISAYLLAT